MGEADYIAREKEFLDTMPEAKLFAKQCEGVRSGEESTSNVVAADNASSSKKKREVICIDEEVVTSKVVDDEDVEGNYGCESFDEN